MGTRRQIAPALPIVQRFGRAHRKWLTTGLVGTLAWVAIRLAMPWPLKGVIEAAFPGGDARMQTLDSLLPSGIDPVLQLCGVYFVLALGLGVAELFQRGAMGRFATRTVDDLRDAALRGVGRRGRQQEAGGHGELISRLVGDAARLREDLRGILIHATQNTLLFIAIVVLFLVLSPQMGLFFLLGGVLATAIGYRAARPAAKSAGRQRATEGTYAATLEVALAQGNIALIASESSEPLDDEDGVGTGLFDAPTLHIHLVLAAMVVAALLTGIEDVRSGRLAPGQLFLFVAYALTVHRRLVQLGRQLARVGKVRASVDRLAELLHDGDDAESAPVVRPLFSGIRVVQARIDSARGHGDKPRLRSMDLTLPAGARVAVLGKAGAGKSSFLRAVAGLELLAEGTIYWDDVPLDANARPSVAYLPQDPVFAPQRVAQVLGVDASAGPSTDQLTLLERVGAWDTIRRLPRGLEDKVGSMNLSKQEGRALGLAAILLGSASVWVLDAPLEGLSGKQASKRLNEILERTKGRTLLVSLLQLKEPERFDRVIVLKHGKLQFDGTPREWHAWKNPPKEASSCGA